MTAQLAEKEAQGEPQRRKIPKERVQIKHCPVTGQHKLEHGRFPLNTRQHLYAMWVLEHWQRLLRGYGFFSLEIFRSFLVMSQDTLIWVFLLEQWLDQMDPEVPSNMNHSVIL